MKRHKTFFVDSFKEHNFCDTKYFEIRGSEFELPFEVKPTTGEHDYNNCEGCQSTLKTVFDRETKKFDKFPLCCSAHANLVKEKWFNKNEFGNIPLQVSHKIVFTNQHIINNIDKEDWFTEITNYIDYVIQSFGKMPTGFGEPVCIGDYFFCIADFLTQKDSINKDKLAKILEYLNSYKNHKVAGADFNILISTYQKWLKIFPFQISYFQGLKQQFENTLPILNDNPIYNPYLGLAKAKMQTHSGLIESLNRITKQLLSEIHTKELVEKGLITDTAAHTLELINETHRIKQSSLLGEYVKGEIKYINILKAWLTNEKIFFKEIAALINTKPQADEPIIQQTKAEKLRTKISEFGFFQLELVKCLSIEKQNQLIEMISTNRIPYKIAMFDYLGFIKYLVNTHFPVKYKLNKEVSKWFNSDKDGRAVKANISSLLKNSTEDKKRYTAYKHKEAVKNDYQKLK